MKFTLEVVGLGNAAFVETPQSAGYELARILETVAARLKETPDLLNGGFEQPLHDAYGNRVGQAMLK